MSPTLARLAGPLTGPTGWYRVERRGVELTFSPADLSQPCAAPTSEGPVIVLVHGFGDRGEAPEWSAAVGELGDLRPAAIYMFRWWPYDERWHVLDQMVLGVDRLAACRPNARLLMLAHSAGGLVAASAASRFHLEPGASLELVTVASPLAGYGFRRPDEAGDDDVHLTHVLGGTQLGYRAAAAGVAVEHCRTRYPADQVMKTRQRAHPPNAAGIGVDGGEMTDLPPWLDHQAALTWVARQLGLGLAPCGLRAARRVVMAR
jgi:pimeloyl-ACP methyl ester carboxylesterase